MREFLASVNYLEVLRTVAVLSAVIIAYSALNTWKHQAKAQKQTKFLDELTDAVHEYIQALSQPIEFLKFIYLSIDSHRGLPSSDEGKEYSHVIAYIESRGSKDSKLMWEYLKSSSDSMAKINSLVARGQVYAFQNYDSCRESVETLLRQHQRLQAVASIVGSTNMNWQHPAVIKSIEEMLTVEPSDIELLLLRYDLNFVSFIDENYKKIYSGT